MPTQLRSKNGRIALAVAGCLVLAVAAWFLLVSPQRSKAADLDEQIAAVDSQIATRKAELAQPRAKVKVRASDVFRLGKAIRDATDMPGIMFEVGRLARLNDVQFESISPGTAVPLTGYTVQPVNVVLVGRFADVSSVLREVRSLVRLRKGRLDARGRLFSVDQVTLGQPEGEKQFPVVKASLTLNAFVNGGAAPVPETSVEEAEASGAIQSTQPSSSGTAAAGATP
jgi:hypothetical protein